MLVQNVTDESETRVHNAKWRIVMRNGA